MRRVWFLLAAFVIVLVATITSPRPGYAARYTPPPLTGHVVDGTGAMTPEQIAAVDRKLTAFRKQTGFAIVAFVAPTLEGLPIDDVAYDTFNTWKIGDEGKDNGVLLVLAPNERKSRIETGKGVGGEITDLESIEILRTYVTPAMRDGDIPRAVDTGTEAIQKALSDELPPSAAPPPTAQEQGPPESPFPSWIVMVGIGLLALLSIVSPTARYILFGLLQTFLFMRGGGGGGRGGFGGGGYSGGGGRSGGGGAGDSY